MADLLQPVLIYLDAMLTEDVDDQLPPQYDGTYPVVVASVLGTLPEEYADVFRPRIALRIYAPNRSESSALATRIIQYSKQVISYYVTDGSGINWNLKGMNHSFGPIEAYDTNNGFDYIQLYLYAWVSYETN